MVETLSVCENVTTIWSPCSALPATRRCRAAAPPSPWEHRSAPRPAGRGRERVAGLVGREHPQVVLAIGGGRGVPGHAVGRSSCRRRRDCSTCSRPCGEIWNCAEADAGAAVGRVRRHRDARAVHERVAGRRSDRAGRRRVVDADVGDRRRGEYVADVVGCDHAQIVEPVGEGGGVPGRRERGERVGRRRGSTTCPRRPGRSGTAPRRRRSRRCRPPGWR